MAMLTDTNPPIAAKPLNLGARISAFFGALAAGNAAARDFERLQGLTEEALAAKGLTRETVARAVLERNFG
jgi:hypothetical protein